MLRLQTKIATLKSIKSSSSTSPYQLLLKRVQRTSSASYRGNFHIPSSFFSPKSTSPVSNRKSQLTEPLPYSTNSLPFDANLVKCCSSDSIQSDSRPPSSYFINSFSNLVKSKNYPEAIYLYKKFASSSGLPSNFFILNILLNSYCNLKLASGCGFSVFGVILKKGFFPNTITFTSMIKGLCLEEKIGEASKLFRKMIQLGFNPNVVSCTTLISGLCSAGNSTAALDLHREMLNGKLGFGCKRVTPTLVSYGSLIDGVCKAGLLTKAKELLFEMKSRGISPNVVVYTSLLNMLCLSGRWVEARLLYLEMVDDGVQANVVTLHSILSSLCKQGKANMVPDLIARGGDPNDLVHMVLMEIKEN